MSEQEIITMFELLKEKNPCSRCQALIEMIEKLSEDYRNLRKRLDD